MTNKDKSNDVYALCPATNALKLISGKWNLTILSVLCKNDVIRYNELKRQVHGITGTMLNQSLKELLEFGLVNRVQFAEVPPRVEYSLTNSGKELSPIIEQLEQWGSKNLQ